MKIVNDLSQNGYHIAFQKEHLEEISYQYDNRLSLLEDPELTWPDLVEYENRFENHFMALELSQIALSLEWALQQCEEGDSGEFFGAISLFCRQNRFDLFLEALDKADGEDEDYAKALQDALCFELPLNWVPQLLELYNNEELQPWYSSIIYALAYRRIESAVPIVEKFITMGDDESQLPTFVWAMGRLSILQLIPVIRERIKTWSDTDLLTECARTFVRLGFKGDAMKLFDQVDDPFFQTIAGAPVTNPTPLSMGLSGAFGAVEKLLPMLEDNSTGDEAALALYLITGAKLIEEEFVPEEIDESELFDDELEKLKNGEPLYEPGEEPGSNVVRLSHNVERWQLWLNDNRGQFSPSGKFRLGKPLNKASVVASLNDEILMFNTRKHIVEEMVANYGVKSPFEADMRVVDQQRHLKAL